MTSAAHAREEWAEDRVRDQCFGHGTAIGTGLTFGAELELLAFYDATREIVPIFGPGGSWVTESR